MRHYSRDELLAFLDGNDAVVDLGIVEAHLPLCEPCAGRLGEVAVDYAVLADWTLWNGQPEEEADTARLATFIALHQARVADEAAAAKLYAELAERPQETWLEHLLLSPCGRTAAMMAQLTAVAHAREEAQPREALAILNIAESLGQAVASTGDKAKAQFDIWRTRANALTVMGDYPTALAALDAAEALLGGPVEEFDRAFISWGRANVLFEIGRYSEALPLIESASRVYRQFGDELRETQTRIVLASIYHEQGSNDRAERIFQSLLAPLRVLGDEVSAAKVLCNIACCRLAAGDFAAAEAFGAEAVRMFDRLGLEAEKIRTRWAIACGYLRRGDTGHGVAELEIAAADFSDLGMEVAAAWVRLDIVGAWIDQGAYHRAATIAADLANTFAKAEARLDVVKALAHLRDAARKMNATPELVRTVKHLLAHPGQAFTGPEAEPS